MVSDADAPLELRGIRAALRLLDAKRPRKADLVAAAAWLLSGLQDPSAAPPEGAEPLEPHELDEERAALESRPDGRKAKFDLFGVEPESDAANRLRALDLLRRSNPKAHAAVLSHAEDTQDRP